MKNYPPPFKDDAVALYRPRPQATIRQVAADLRINSEICGTGSGRPERAGPG